MARLPWVKYWYADWTGDMSIQQCSLEARGAWHETLCLFWHEGSYQHTASVKGWALIWRCGTAQADTILNELSERQVAGVTTNEDFTVTLLSRRLEREANKREKERLRKARQRGHADVPPSVTPDVPPCVTGRSQEAQKPRGSEADKLRNSERNISADAGFSKKKWDGKISPVLVEAANDAKLLLSIVGKCLKSGYGEETMLAWCYTLKERSPDNAAAYLRGCLKSKQMPPDDHMRAASNALYEAVEGIDFADALKTIPPPETERAKKARTLRELDQPVPLRDVLPGLVKGRDA